VKRLTHDSDRETFRNSVPESARVHNDVARLLRPAGEGLRIPERTAWPVPGVTPASPRFGPVPTRSW